MEKYIPTKKYKVILTDPPPKTPEEQAAFDRRASYTLGLIYKRQIEEWQKKKGTDDKPAI